MLNAEQLSEKVGLPLNCEAVGLNKGLGLHQDNLFKMPFSFLEKQGVVIKTSQKITVLSQQEKAGN